MAKIKEEYCLLWRIMDQLVRKWSEKYTEEVLEWAHPQEVSNEEVFAEVYHSLIHSPVSRYVSLVTSLLTS